MRALLPLFLVAIPACGPCDPVTADAGPDDSAGVVEVRTALAGGGLEVRLRDLRTPLRALQVDVALSGTTASSVAPAGEVLHDLVEAGLDEPRSSFTLVVGDSRRVALTEGAVASVTTGAAPGDITLTRAIGVDTEGRRVELDVEVRP